MGTCLGTAQSAQWNLNPINDLYGSSDVLVFLNNDTQILSEDWLTRLVTHAASPEVGAVGAKLLYRNGRIQHIGVVLGLGGHAGHFGAMAVDAEPGWHARNLVMHEISAVTGACLAVQRWKFERVGGFDAIHLPIDLNDVDLCLRLAEHGWSALLDPEICLLHDESASRGRGTFRRLAVYASQRRHFQARWRAWIRVDPFFTLPVPLLPRGSLELMPRKASQTRSRNAGALERLIRGRLLELISIELHFAE